MKKLQSSLPAKVLAFVLLVVMAFGCAGSLLAMAVLYEYGGYTESLESMREEQLSSWCMTQCWQTLDAYENRGDTKSLARSMDPAFRFTLFDKDGEQVYSNYQGEEILASVSGLSYGAAPQVKVVVSPAVEAAPGSGEWYMTMSADAQAAEPVGPTPELTASPKPTATPKPTAAPAAADGDGGENEAETVTQDRAIYDAERSPYSITGYVLEEVTPESSAYMMLWLLEKGVQMRYSLLAIALATALAALLLFVFLMAAAGHRTSDGAITAGLTEKLPFDLFTALFIAAETVLLAIAVETGGRIDANVLVITGYAVVFVIAASLLLWWCMSLAVRVKTKSTVKSCLCYRILAWLWRGVKKVIAAAVYLLRSLPLIPRALVVIVGILGVEFIYILIADGDVAAHLLGWFFERLVLVALTVYVLASMKRLLIAGKEIAGGNMDYRVDTAKLRGPLKEHGEALNSITDGMNKAVSGRIKSERFRTELITNVSHDIKTPLTSIVNYVDLMEKEPIENEKMREYLEVLSRQSARLKKLIDDLMEASKASTGNLAVNPEHCELGVMLTQTAGEYEDKLEKAGLELVVDRCEEPLVILADRQHLWRIFDNLMNNICKYSMPGTRVYLSLRREAKLSSGAVHGRAIVTFRNISRSRLNVSEEELMERFVRGDSSRNTEGSGLGLSIANSLTQLQHGQMELIVDGDLFKVELRFDIVE